MPDEIPIFKPSEIWTPCAKDFDLEPAIETARQAMNSKNPNRLIHELQESVQTSSNGIVYAVLKGDSSQEYSNTDALVMFNPFANTATANMLVRAEFIREVAKHADVRDDQGKLKPVIMLTSPGLHGSHLKLSRQEKRQIRSGDLGPAAKEYLKAVSALNYGRVALLGASMGADFAISGSAPNLVVNLDRVALAAAEPAGVKDRTLLELGKNFRISGPDLDERMKDSKLVALDAAQQADPRKDFVRFWLSAASPMSWHTLASGMAHASFESRMQAIIDAGEVDKIVVGYGKSSITPEEAIEPSLAELHAKVDASDLLLTVKVKGGTHAWPEELPVLAKLYLRALT